MGILVWDLEYGAKTHEGRTGESLPVVGLELFSAPYASIHANHLGELARETL